MRSGLVVSAGGYTRNVSALTARLVSLLIVAAFAGTPVVAAVCTFVCEAGVSHAGCATVPPDREESPPEASYDVGPTVRTCCVSSDAVPATFVSAVRIDTGALVAELATPVDAEAVRDLERSDRRPLLPHAPRRALRVLRI